MRYLIILLFVFIASTCYASDYNYATGRYECKDECDQPRRGFAAGVRAGAEAGGDVNVWQGILRGLSQSISNSQVREETESPEEEEARRRRYMIEGGLTEK